MLSAHFRQSRAYPPITSPSRPIRPLSRYRPKLRTCSAIEEIRPADGQRLPSAYPAGCSANLKKDWLPLPFTRLPANGVNSFIIELEDEIFPLCAARVSSPSYTPLSGLHWKPARQSSRNGPRAHHAAALLRAPPRGITGYSLLSGGRQLTGGRDCALVRVPPARHCIFCLSAFRRPLARVSQGTHAGYPLRFSPMRTFRHLPMPKADASQNGFHPAYALSCGLAWRNSLSNVDLSRYPCPVRGPPPGRPRRSPFGTDRITRFAAFVIKPLV